MVDDAAIIAVLAEHVPQIIAAYRFGSTATDSARSNSDVDVAVLPQTPLSGADRLQLAGRLAEAVHCEVDVVDLLRASTVLRMQVVSTGLALPIGDPAARGLFEDRVYSDYARLNEERRAILEQVAREGTIHGG